MLQFNEITFIFTAINLLVLYFALKKILFKPVTKIMEDRANLIKSSLEEAENSKAKAAEIKKSYEDQVRSAKDEVDRILNEGRAKASKEYEAAVASAKKDAEAILVKARQEIERERQQMIKEIKGQVASLALTAASKVIEANMDSPGNRALVDKFIDEAGAA